MNAKQRSLSSLVAQFPHTVPVLEEWSIDYSARGNDTVEEACLRLGICHQEVCLALSRAHAGPAFRDLSALSPADLVSYLRQGHHAYLRDELPRLRAELATVARTYGAALKEIRYVEQVFERLSQDLDQHVWKEELFAFPWISSQKQPDVWVLEALAQDRKVTSFRLDCLRFLTNHYRVPPETGPSYHQLYSHLQAFEKDVRQHVYIEDNFLFAQVA